MAGMTRVFDPIALKDLMTVTMAGPMVANRIIVCPPNSRVEAHTRFYINVCTGA